MRHYWILKYTTGGPGGGEGEACALTAQNRQAFSRGGVSGRTKAGMRSLVVGGRGEGEGVRSPDSRCADGRTAADRRRTRTGRRPADRMTREDATKAHNPR